MSLLIRWVSEATDHRRFFSPRYILQNPIYAIYIEASSMHCPLPPSSCSSRVIKSALRHVSPFHAPKRCRLLVVHPPQSPHYSSFAELREEMLARPPRYSRDYVTPSQSESLRATLRDFLPASYANLVETRARQPHDGYELGALNPMHHLVYFPNREFDRLLPDGTDSLHSPGGPFTRRMWAGGNVSLLQDIPMDGHAFHCSERIHDVYVKGGGEDEKIYVQLKREVFAGRYPGELRSLGVDYVLSRKVYVLEERVLVFMRAHDPDQDAIISPLRRVAPKEKPDFYRIMQPTRNLLFRFSALTFNAHAIHLDKAYCREVEGYRNLLVQGNLMVVLVIEVLQSYLLARVGGWELGSGSSFKRPWKEPERIWSLRYQNLRPLYVDEKLKICVKRIEKKDHLRVTHWEVWIEGYDGGFSFRGRARTYDPSSVASRPVEDHVNDHQESNLDEEPLPDEATVPNEHVALQKEANAGVESHLIEGAPREKIQIRSSKGARKEGAPYLYR